MNWYKLKSLIRFLFAISMFTLGGVNILVKHDLLIGFILLWASTLLMFVGK